MIDELIKQKLTQLFLRLKPVARNHGMMSW
jgi:hypothetical protein